MSKLLSFLVAAVFAVSTGAAFAAKHVAAAGEKKEEMKKEITKDEKAAKKEVKAEKKAAKKEVKAEKKAAIKEVKEEKKAEKK